MKTPQRQPLFLARQTYRRRRLMDAARMLPVAGILLLLLPMLWTPRPGAPRLTAGDGIYLFVIWAVLILAARLLAPRLDSPKPGDDGAGDGGAPFAAPGPPGPSGPPMPHGPREGDRAGTGPATPGPGNAGWGG